MLRLLKFLFSGCFHVWDDVDEQTTWTDGFGGRHYMQPMKCQKCGERKAAHF